MDQPAHFAIGGLAKQTGTNVETIRYYERIGLWRPPARTAGGYRVYGTPHLKRLSFIRRARALGFSIGELRMLLRLSEESRRPCAEVRVVAEAHLADVQAKIADLKAMERVLRETVARCAHGNGSHCPLIDALYRDPSSPVRRRPRAIRLFEADGTRRGRRAARARTPAASRRWATPTSTPRTAVWALARRASAR